MSAEVIQANYDQLEALAARFARQAEVQQQVLARVRQDAARLQGGSWEGKGIAAFSRELDGQVAPAMQRLVAALREGQASTQMMVSIIQRAEQEAAGLFNVTASSNGAVTGPGDLALAGLIGGMALLPYRGWDYADTLLRSSRTFIDVISNGIDYGLITKTGFSHLYHGIGVLLNNLTGQRGYIGKMEEMLETHFEPGALKNSAIGKLLKSTKFLFLMGLLDASVGFALDVKNKTYGNDYLKAGVVDTTDAGIQLGLTASKVGFLVQLANVGIQIGGQLESAAVNTMADTIRFDEQSRVVLESNAASYQAAVTQMDLNRVTKRLSEALYESTIGDIRRGDLFSSETGKSWAEAGKTTTGVLDSFFIDYPTSQAAMRSNVQWTLITQAAKHMPISDSLKQGITDTATQMMQLNTQQAAWFGNLFKF